MRGPACPQASSKPPCANPPHPGNGVIARNVPWEAFFPDRNPYLGRAVLGEPLTRPNVLFRTGDTNDETSIRRARHPPPQQSPFREPAPGLTEAFLAVRNETERRAAPLTAEDQLIQSMPDASPAKWHRAHTTWFFEQFLLGEHCRGLQPFRPRLCLPVQFLLCHRRPPARPSSARPPDPARRR